MHISDLVRHADVLEKAKNAARKIIAEDPALSAHSQKQLKQRVQKMFGEDIKLEL